MSEFTHRLPHQPWSKPSRNEEEYFHREEFRRRIQAAREREARKLDEERRRLLRFRDHCPKCGGKLEALELEDGRADQCPACLGVWLDQETFDHLTHPSRPNEYLTGILREVMLQYTTGAVNPDQPD